MTADEFANSWWSGMLIFFGLTAGPFILIWIWVRFTWWLEHRRVSRADRRACGALGAGWCGCDRKPNVP